MRIAALLALPLLVSAAPVETGEVTVPVSGLRSTSGQVLACLTTQAKGFPDCTRDAAARKLAVSADGVVTFRFSALPPGRYAISLLHDENGNGKADMMLILPREGFGFSRDAAVRLGPPKFATAAFAVDGDAVTVPVRMRYII
jgi:uncharacterized protein (DUF2141 family)